MKYILVAINLFILSSSFAQNYKHYFKTAIKYYKAGSYDTAIQYFDSAISKNNKRVNAFFNRGLCHAELDNHFKAENDFNYYLQKFPKDASAYHERAKSRSQILDSNGAKEDFDMSVLINPTKRIFRIERSLFYTFEMKDHQESINDMNVLIELDSTDSKALYMKGYNHFMLEEYDSSIKALKQSLKLDSTTDLAYYLMGKSYYFNDEDDNAIICFSNAIQINATDPRYFEARGLAYIYNNNEDDDYLACQDFETALKLGSKKAQKLIDDFCTEEN